MPKKPSSPLISIRSLALEILQDSKGILTLHPDLVIGLLRERLESFRISHKENTFVSRWLSAEDEIGACLFFNTVNFCFKDPASGNEYRYINPDGKPFLRSTGFFQALADSKVHWNDLQEVSELSETKWMEITQLTKENVLYLGQERLNRIIGFARYLIASKCPTAAGFLQSHHNQVLEILTALINSGYFEDEFLKRAQVAIKNIDKILFHQRGFGLYGMDALTCMADYRLPQVFYNLGIVELSLDLKEKLTRQELIIPGSREERALRAAVIVIGQQLSHQMGINEAEIDDLLWEMSQKMVKENEMKIPHMLVATDKY
jgi:hypothetical protein